MADNTYVLVDTEKEKRLASGSIDDIKSYIQTHPVDRENAELWDFSQLPEKRVDAGKVFDY